MTKLDFSMFTQSGLFEIDGYTYHKIHFIRYYGKCQVLELSHRFLDSHGRPINRFCIFGVQFGDVMQVRTVEDMRAVAVLMVYDDEILGVIDSLMQNEECNAECNAE